MKGDNFVQECLNCKYQYTIINVTNRSVYIFAFVYVLKIKTRYVFLTMSELPGKNKRPLSTIESNVLSPKVPKKSVSFEDSTVENRKLEESNANAKDDLEMQQIESEKVVKGMDVDQISKLIGMNDQYNAQKTKPAVAFVFDKSDLGTKSNIAEEIDYLNDRLPILAKEHKELLGRLNKFEEDIRDIKRNNQKIILKNKELQNLITISQRKFENLETSITRNVMNREELVNYKIKEFKQRLKSQMEEIKFALKEELNLAKSYKDEDIEETIKTFTTKKTELLQELSSIDNKRNVLLKDEETKLQKLLTDNLSPSLDRNELLQIQLKTKEGELNRLKEDFTDLETNKMELFNESERLKKLSINLQENADNYSVSKSNLTNKLTTAERKMARLEAIDLEYSKNLERTNNIFRDVDSQHKKSEETILALENSILQLETNRRIYISTQSNEIQASEDIIRFANGSVKVHKILPVLSLEDAMKEFKFYFSSIIKSQLDNTIVLCGDKAQDGLFHEMILRLHRESIVVFPQSSSSCRAAVVSDSIQDTFDSERKIEAFKKSQVMLIDDPENFEIMVKKATIFGGTKVFELQIISDKETNYRIIDLTSVPKSIQFSNQILNALIKEYDNAFYFCQMNDLGESTPLLEYFTSL